MATTQFMAGAPGPNWTLALLRGIAAIIFGLLAIAWPGPALRSLVLLFSAYMLVDGVLAFGAAMHAARQGESWAWFALGGVVDIAAAVVAFLLPAVTVLAFITLLAIWSVISGIALLVAAARLQGRPGRPWLALGGIVSVIWGVALFVWPGVGALVMVLWLGAYALVFGITFVALALRMRREQRVPLHQWPA